jgi:uncharacterized protein (DUF2236 family)
VPAPLAWLNRVITIGLLPASVRDQYRYGWNDRRARQFDRVVSAMRGLHRITPRALAWWPEARRDTVMRATTTSSSPL